MSKVHDFHECNKIAENGKAESFWIDVYKKAFPNITNLMPGKKEKCNSQEGGVDRIIYLENHKMITVDEKIRTEVYQDIALEFISNDRKNTPGWMEKPLTIDYLAYAFLPIKTTYLFDWRMLKRSWNHYKESWKDKYWISKARNQFYTTHCVCVPIDVLMKACQKATIIIVDDPKNNADVSLSPITPIPVGRQISLF